ncbi:MAG TPA: hypothetical protein DIV54_08400, partial [Verrucomicrobiales bacterium]|nr:hypothetical protein [Verrucomicrobiales bacterium]
MNVSPRASAILLTALIAPTLPTSADYEVDLDLGSLSEGITSLSGTTAEFITDDPQNPEVKITIGGRNNADNVRGSENAFLTFNINEALSWGDELVHQFTIDAPADVNFIPNQDVAWEGDPDFFLLEGLTTDPDAIPGKTVAIEGLWYAFMDEASPPTGTVTLRPGTYYFVVESYSGPDTSPIVQDSTFAIDIEVLPALFPDEVSIDLGNLGTPLDPLSFDTFGSDFDTQIAIFSSDTGELVEQNDDDPDDGGAGDGTQSRVTFAEGLAEGSYIAVVAGGGTTFDVGPVTALGGATGNIVFNHTASSTDLDAINGVGTQITSTSPGTEVSETVWFEFQIVDSGPSSFQDIGKVADAFAPFELNTFTGTSVDTELGLYDANGNLVLNNDDAGGSLQSQLDFATGLAEGFYFLVVGTYNTQFNPLDFDVTLGGSGGSYTLTHPNGLETGNLGAASFDWYRLEVGSPVGGGGGGG